MKKPIFTEEQIAFAHMQVESGAAIQEIIRELGMNEQIIYRWKKEYTGLGVAELRRLKHLEE